MNTMRKKKMVTLTLDPDLIASLEAWLAKQEFPPAKNAVVEAALMAWLDGREMSDLVPELRDTAQNLAGGIGVAELCAKAAAEIERLRDRLDLIATSPHSDSWAKDRAKAALLPIESGEAER